MNRTSSLPYTEAERDRDDKIRAEALKRMWVRRKAAPNGDYNQPGTPESRQKWRRILGENDED